LGGTGLDPRELLERAMAFCGYPRMMEPELVVDPGHHPHAEKLNGRFGLWEPSENRVYINLPEVHERLGLENLEAVLVYQLLHYALAPFDARTALKLTASAKVALDGCGGDEERGRGATFSEALNLQRVFCDVINVTYAALHGMKEEMIRLYRAMDRDKGWRSTMFWKFLLCLFEELWDCRGSLLEWAPRSLREDARRMGAVLLTRPFSATTWEEKIRLMAGFFRKYYRDGDEMDDARLMDHGIDELRGRSMEQLLREVSAEMGLQDFKDIVCGLGEGSEVQALVWFYRDLARRYEVRIRPVRSESGEEVPYAPRAWGLGDPVEKLDLAYTLYTSGLAVPTLTTKQWERTRLDIPARRKTPPDVVIVLDASGSMTNPSVEVANAVLAGFVLARSAANMGAKVGLVVYSDQQRSFLVEPTWHLRRVEEGLVTYYGGGTVFPVEEFRYLYGLEPHRPKHFCLISDTEIVNLQEARQLLEEALAVHPENSGSIFLVDQSYNRNAEVLREAGYQVFPVTRGEDLVKVVAGKAHELYAW
jgi:hypothetical protein